jgi:MFS transporter, ACS family, D-galactonate transporter
MLHSLRMSSATQAPSQVGSRIQWFVLWLLVISVCINYIDRGNLSVATVALKQELGLRPSQLGLLFSAFFWTYAGFMIFAGWLIDRYNVIWVYAAGYLLWSCATALTGLVSGFGALFGLRLLLGMSESVAYPAYSKIISAGFPERQRGMANGLIDAGSKLGPALGLIVGGTILAHFGWRALFLSIGLVSLLWIVPWCIVAPKIRTASLTNNKGGAGFLEIMSKRDAWGTFLCLFCANYGWYFMLTWLPGYLQMERHYSTETMALAGSLPFWAVAGGALFGGSVSDVWIARGGNTTVVRKTFVITGLSGCALFLLPAAMAQNQIFAMTLLVVASFSFGLFSSNAWCITQTLAGPLASGKWTGLQNCAGNLAGVVAPVVTGFIVERTGSFFFAFIWVCANLLIGALSFLFIVGKIQPVAWKSASPPMF